MPIRFSPVVATRARGEGSAFSIRSIDLEALGDVGSPVALLDDFRVSGRPFGPHPHAGFSAVTYVFEDSPGSLRSRDSLGDDLVVDPGGLVWTLAGSGVLHEEIPAEPGPRASRAPGLREPDFDEQARLAQAAPSRL